jgi:hypothetical protein
MFYCTGPLKVKGMARQAKDVFNWTQVKAYITCMRETIYKCLVGHRKQI